MIVCLFCHEAITVQDLREAKLHVLSEEECRTNTVPLEQEVNTNITYCAGYKFGVISGCQVNTWLTREDLTIVKHDANRGELAQIW